MLEEQKAVRGGGGGLRRSQRPSATSTPRYKLRGGRERCHNTVKLGSKTQRKLCKLSNGPV